MKIQPKGDYITYHIDEVTVFADKPELMTMQEILGDVARQYYGILSKVQKLKMAEDIIEKAIHKIGEI